MKQPSQILWIEKYRPQKLNEVCLSTSHKKFFEKIIKEKNIHNLLFFGEAGQGKTTLAKVLCNEIGCEYLYLNGSLENSIDDIRTKVSSFAFSKSVFDNTLKVVILDEADRLGGGNSSNAMESLKVLMEQVHKQTRFILCTNNIHRIIDPLKSRMHIIQLIPEDKKGRNEVAKQYIKRLKYILEKENVKYDDVYLKEIVKHYFPDLRKIINESQRIYETEGKLTKETLKISLITEFKDLIESLKERNFTKMVKEVANVESNYFFNSFYKSIKKVVEPQELPKIVEILGEYNKFHNLCADKQLNVLACCLELMKTIKGWL